MTKLDPIIAVKDVAASSKWYQSLFGWKSKHGGDEFDVLTQSDGEIMLCLHMWGTHEHPTMKDPGITPGNGLILYFRTDDMDTIRKNAEKMGIPPEEEIHLNENSQKKEFSLRDPDGYYLSITEYHTYEG
jgi:predicted enzyme related to lactoylglutathione lyase